MTKFLELSRNLFSIYSPLKTNASLLKEYEKLVGECIDTNDVRYLYNNIIQNNYINESVVKASFIDRNLRHKSPHLNVTIFELKTGNSRADLCVMNGSSSVFEIKTEFDTYDRLQKQLTDYLDFFDYLNIIVPECEISNVDKIIHKNVGIIYYYKNRLGNLNFKTHRKPIINLETNSISQLNSLTKLELLKHSHTNNTSLSRDELISLLISKYDKDEINKLYREAMKLKYYDKWNFLSNNLSYIYPLDYQWFYKNNIDYKIVYK